MNAMLLDNIVRVLETFIHQCKYHIENFRLNVSCI